jgi:anti-sigma regulatory factor (Ser/Thr protein kinase)
VDFGIAEQFPMDEVDLVISETFTNAVIHAGRRGTDVTVAVELRGSLLRLEVHDPDVRSLVTRKPSEWDDSGRGLLLVESLSHRWGVLPRTNGKVVFAEIAPCGGVDTDDADSPLSLGGNAVG